MAKMVDPKVVLMAVEMVAVDLDQDLHRPFVAGVGEAVEREVARGDLVPRRRDADLGLLPVLVAHADRAEHASGRCPLEAIGHVAAAGLDVRGIAHGFQV